MKISRYGIVTILFMMGSGITGCATTYSYNPIELHVVDAETKKPVEDVIVVAHWTLVESTVGGNSEIGTLQVMETVSDKNGRVYFPQWGPKTVFRGRLDRRGAQLHFFKPGYEIKSGGNDDMDWQSKHPKTSEWHGLIIKMKRFSGSLEEYAEHVVLYDNDLKFARYGDHCEWEKIPLTLVELNKLSDEITKNGIKLEGWRAGIKIRTIYDVHVGKNCNQPGDFFKKYIQ